MRKTELRSRWCRMLSRCEDEDYRQWQDYGGRGIYVCDEWHDFHKFYEWCMENDIEKKLQIDRINNDGPYSPENCRIVSRAKNNRNRSNTLMLTAFGETKSTGEWLEDVRCTVDYRALYSRVSRGWSHEDAIARPSGVRIARPHNEKVFEAFGETKTLRQWSNDDRCIVRYNTLFDRVHHMKWDVEKALVRPTGPQSGH